MSGTGLITESSDITCTNICLGHSVHYKVSVGLSLGKGCKESLHTLGLGLIQVMSQDNVKYPPGGWNAAGNYDPFCPNIYLFLQYAYCP